MDNKDGVGTGRLRERMELLARYHTNEIKRRIEDYHREADYDPLPLCEWDIILDYLTKFFMEKGEAALAAPPAAVTDAPQAHKIPDWMWEPFTNNKGEPLMCSVCGDAIPRIDNGWHGDCEEGVFQHTDCSYQKQIKDLQAKLAASGAPSSEDGARPSLSFETWWDWFKGGFGETGIREEDIARCAWNQSKVVERTLAEMPPKESK
jgi:hypothetical protein